jgi:hypothetical protein
MDCNIQVNLKTCEECTIATVQQKNVNKNWSGSSNVPASNSTSASAQLRERNYGGAMF